MDFIEYNGKRYSIKKIYKLIDMYENSKIGKVTIHCPLCQVNLYENGLFMCDECLQIKELGERCNEHPINSQLCTECCEECDNHDYL